MMNSHPFELHKMHNTHVHYSVLTGQVSTIETIELHELHNTHVDYSGLTDQVVTIEMHELHTTHIIAYQFNKFILTNIKGTVLNMVYKVLNTILTCYLLITA